MAELQLPQQQRLALRAQAHRLRPVVLLGAGGLSAPALREIDRAFDAHGLVKIRAGRGERASCAAWFLAIAQALGAARIQALGHTLVLYRPVPERNATRPAPAAGADKDRRPAAKGIARGKSRRTRTA